MERRSVIQLIKEYGQRQRRTRRWQWKVGGLACVVVLLTGYLLILPALTMSRENPVLKASAASARPGESLTLEVVASPETDQEETYFYLDATADHVGLTEEAYNFQDEIASITVQDGSTVELHQDVEGDSVNGYWFTLEKDRGETTLSLEWTSDEQQEEAAQALSAEEQGDGAQSQAVGGSLLVKAGSGSTLDEAKTAAERVETATTLSWVNADEVSAPEAAPMSEVTSGECGDQGDNLTWTLTEDGVLTISGTGKMADYNFYSPWEDMDVKQVVVQEGVTYLGKNSFRATSLVSIDLPSTLTEIGPYAFEQAKSLREIQLPESLEEMQAYAFMGCQSLREIEIPSSCSSTGNRTFEDCTSLEKVVVQNGVSSIQNSFSGCTALKEVVIPDTVRSIASNAFENCISLESITIPTSVTSVGSGAFGYCYNLKTVEWNALDASWYTSKTYSSFRVVLGDGVVLSSSTVANLASSGCEDIVVTNGYSFQLENDLNISGWIRPLSNLSAGTYLAYGEENALYRLVETEDGALKEAVLTYVPSATHLTVPKEVLLNGVAYQVVGVGTYALARCQELETLQFEQPDQITTLDDYAFADARKLSQINGKTEIEQIKQLFTSATIGNGVFSNTALSGEGGSSVVQGPIQIVEEDLTVKIETVKDRMDGDTRLFWTGENPQTSISISNPTGGMAADKKIRIYFQFSTSMGKIAEYEIGKDYIFDTNNGKQYTMKFRSTNVPGTYYMEIDRPDEGDTISLNLNSTYPSPNSSGGTAKIWGVILNPEELEGKVVDAEQYHLLRWETKPSVYNLEKTTTWKTMELTGDQHGGAYLDPVDQNGRKNSIKYTVTLNREGEQLEGGLGADYRSRIVFEDRVTLPELVKVAPGVKKALEDGTYTISSSTYSGTTLSLETVNQAGESVTCTIIVKPSTSSYEIKYLTARVEQNEETGLEELVVTWEVWNTSNSKEMNLPNVSVSFSSGLFWTEDVVEFNAKYEASQAQVLNQIFTTTMYSYSGPQQASAECSVPVSLGESGATLEKDYVGKSVSMGRFGNDAPFVVTLTSTGAMPFDLTGHWIKDEMDQNLFVSPDDLESLFDQAKASGNYDLTVTISDATLYQPIEPTSVTVVDGSTQKMTSLENTSLHLMYHGLETPAENGENVVADHVTLTLQAVEEGYSLRFSNEAGEPIRDTVTVPRGQLQEKLLENGYIVTHAATYQLIWRFHDNFVLAGGANITFDVPACAKSTFEYIQQDSIHASGIGSYYPYNYAYLYNDTGAQLDSDQTDADMRYAEFSLDYTGYIDGVDVEDENVDLKLGDVIDCVSQFAKEGERVHELVPLVNKTIGAQVVLAPVEDNQGADWAKDLKTTVQDGVSYYILDRAGKYSGVWLGGAYADSVTVTTSEEGWDTLIKWYFMNVDDGHEIRYKTLVQIPEDSTASYYMINNESWLNDSPTHRLYAPFGEIPVKMVDIEKKIVTSVTDTGEGVDRTTVNEGNIVYYRLAFMQRYSTSEIVVEGKDIQDLLPKNISGYTWTTDNVKVTALEESKQYITNPDRWTIQTSESDNTQQYIQWGDDMSIRLSGGGTAYIYVALTFPSDSVWDDYASKYATETLTNTLCMGVIRDTVYHDIYQPAQGRLQMGVYAQAYISDDMYLVKNEGDSRYYYVNNALWDRGVVYYVTLYNEGAGKLYLTDMQQLLPEGFTLYGVGSGDNASTIKIEEGEMTTTSAQSTWFLASVTDVNTTGKYKKVGISASSKSVGDGQDLVTFSFSQSTLSDISYDESRDLCYLKPGEAIVFAYGCQTNNWEDTQDFAQTTITMPYLSYNGSILELDKDHPAKAYDRSSAEENNGSTELREKEQMDGVFTNGVDVDQWLVSEVASVRGNIAPGITKSLVTPSNGIAKPLEELKWKITAYNDGRLPIDGYVITDQIQAPYQFTGQIQFSVYSGWNTTTAASTGSLTLSRTEGSDQVEVRTSNESRMLTVNGDPVSVTVPLSSMVGIGTPRMPIQIAIERDEESGAETLSIYVQEVGTDPNETIHGAGSLMEHGRMEITLSTKNFTNVVKNSVYVNSATLTPVWQKWDGSVNYGNFTTITTPFTGEQEMASVRNSAPVTVTVGYATTSEKAVSQGNNQASSMENPNYIILDEDQTAFSYTLEVENSDRTIDKLILLDNLPEIGDHSTFVEEDLRFSEFKVSLADDPNFKVTVNTADGTVQELTSDQYAIEYSTKTTFDANDWNGENPEDWKQSSQEARSFRLTILEPLEAESVVNVTFDAQVDGEAAAGQTAWNSFGYHYWVDDTELEAAPLKVGVRVSSIPELVKQLETPEGDPAYAEQDMSFEFLIYAGNAIAMEEDFTKESLLAELAEAGRAYTSVTLQVNQGQTQSETKVLDQLTGYTYDQASSQWLSKEWTWTQSSSYTIVELPSDDSYGVHYNSINGRPTLTYTFIYNNASTQRLNCVNTLNAWQILIHKTDSTKEMNLAGAVFALYSPNAVDAMDDDAYEALVEKPTKTVEHNGVTYYLMRVTETAESGDARFNQLIRDKYLFLEIKAPDGYQIGSDNAPQLVEWNGEDEVTMSYEVVNTVSYDLPKTGGIGTTSLYFTGGFIMVCAAVLYGYEKRRRKGGTT